MIGIEHIWGAVGCAMGTCFACIVLVIRAYIEDRFNERRKINGR